LKRYLALDTSDISFGLRQARKHFVPLNAIVDHNAPPVQAGAQPVSQPSTPDWACADDAEIIDPETARFHMRLHTTALVEQLDLMSTRLVGSGGGRIENFNHLPAT
jgi:hypothetical protein